MTRPRVAVDIVTGFLGSGKTTLLRGLLANTPARERVAVIVNELGEIGIDGRVLTGFDFLENVVELTDGCICCSIDEYRFDFAIDELQRRLDPTLIVIETTGVADPAPTIERVQRCGLGLDAVITVVDALSWTRAWRMSGAARRQIEAADFLVMSKLDLVDVRTRAALEKKLRRLAPRAAVVAADHGALASDVLLATSVRRYRDVAASGDAAAGSPGQAGNAAGHLADEKVECFAVRCDRPLDRRSFESFLAGLPAAVWRAKGFVQFAGSAALHLFNFTCGRFEIAALPIRLDLSGPSPGQGEAALQAVFIGRDVLALRTPMESRLAACHSNGATSAHRKSGARGERSAES